MSPYRQPGERPRSALEDVPAPRYSRPASAASAGALAVFMVCTLAALVLTWAAQYYEAKRHTEQHAPVAEPRVIYMLAPCASVRP